MPVLDLSGVTVGSGSAAGIFGLNHGAAAELGGTSSLHGDSRLQAGAHAHLGGSSSFSAQSVIIVDLAGTAYASSLVEATLRIVFRTGGLTQGNGAAFLGTGPITHFAEASLAGASAITGTVSRAMIFSGQLLGQGTFADELLISTSGTSIGSGSLEGSLGHIIGLSGTTYGHGSFDVSVPEPLIGVGTLTGVALILRVPPPVCGPICGCHRCCGRREERCYACEQWHDHRHRHREHSESWWQCHECWERHAFHRMGTWWAEPEKHHREWSRCPNPDGLIPDFRWHQTFGKGDLEICILDRFGNQRGPVFIGYTLFMLYPTGVLHQVGPTDRKPAKADVGKFYVTGMAGENGQPGCWAARWRYQRTYSDPITEQFVQFRVVDAVLAGEHDRRRHDRYGWGWDT